jgi:large repetitive protein
VIFRKRRLAAAILAPATMIAAALGATAAASPASAAPNYPPPSIHLLCTAANGGTLEGTVCALPFGVTTAPNSYTATIAVSKAGAAGRTVAFAVTAGSLPSGLSLTPSSGSSGAITGNPTRAGTFNFTIKATDGGLTATLAYEITITVAGPPDQLLCTPAANGGFLVSGVCELPDAVTGLPYQGHLVTSHQAGGTLSVVSGSLPPGLSLPATFTGPGDTIGGAATGQGSTFTVQGTGDQGQPLFQAYSILVDQNEPLAINPPSGGSALSPGMVGGAYAQDFFLSGGAAPYAWSLASGQLPPGLTLQTSGDPRDASNELAGTATTAGTFAFTMRLTDYAGQQATQQFTLVIDPPLQISTTPLPPGTVGTPYSHDLIAQGGTPPYSWSVVDSINELPPGLTLGTTAPDFNNVLTGTPTKAGTFSFPMQVQDSQDNSATGTVTITINP